MTTTCIQPAEQLRAIVSRTESLYEDLEFKAVREWKERTGGRGAIGFLPIYAPREVIHACGALPVGIMGGADRIEIVRGDSYFQSYICHIPRSVIELAVTGRLDAMDGFIFPSICDVIRNLSGMFKLLFPEKFIHYLDLPQNFRMDLGGTFYIREMQRMAEGTAKITGILLTSSRLRDSIRIYNANRAALASLVKARRERPWEIPTIEYYLLLRAGYMLPPEEHTAMVEDYLALARQAGRQRKDNIRVLVRGAFCEQPPLGLLRTLERAGCYVVDDDFVLGTRMVHEAVDEDGDPFEALAKAFMEHSLPTASKYDVRRNKSELLIEAVRRSRADGVVLMAPSFCDPALLDQPMLQQALDSAGVPYTTIKYSEDTGQFQVIREQAGTFSDAIKLWGKA